MVIIKLSGAKYMKKMLLILLLPLFLASCADKAQYEEVVLEEMKKEQDVKDYKIDPAYMAKCVHRHDLPTDARFICPLTLIGCKRTVITQKC